MRCSGGRLFQFQQRQEGAFRAGYEFLRDAIDQEIELLEYDLAKRGFTPWGTHDAVTIRAASADGVFTISRDKHTYNALGQPVIVAYSNGATTSFTYEANTFRLKNLHS
ncbi:MAG: hypothetical protein E8D45_10220 [Nitrospira sp.]|nr:MAG: hypothetical protein E8D45_10220 [Nitrospira sp.]